ncbi:MAG: hypothetical protein HXS46_13025 [Theionarchaea archaeon]|nr:MAG: hypothetical protein AYK18_11745 [Theionarchaea archaeon DG-70]MBU7011606.1 hypothetical protein [Theionarchaea archaeon]
MVKVNGWGQFLGLPSITVEQQAFLLIIMKNGQKGSTQEEIQQRAEEEGIYFSGAEILRQLRELEDSGLVRFSVYKSMERWYTVLEVA